MTSDILGRPLEDYNSLYIGKADSSAGRQLATLIEKNTSVLEQATLNGRPAIAPLFSLLASDLAEALHADNHLLQTFGHLVGADMQGLGYHWDVSDSSQRQKVNWPYSAKVSECQVYRPE